MSKLRASAHTPLSAIDHFVVLMLENRSFDHLFGYLKKKNPKVAGMDPGAHNYVDPIAKKGKIAVSRAARSALAFDPAHEFPDVQVQMYGPAAGGGANPPSGQPVMSGFVCSSVPAGGAEAIQVMECFEPDQLPVFTKLAEEFALFNYWYSPMPGPTWPNRFFVHAGTSGGLFESPSTWDIVKGYGFKRGTLFDRLEDAGKSWRVYHGDWPQVIGVNSLRLKYFDFGDRWFREISTFFRDAGAGDLPTYSFIEPCYDAFDHFVDGDSMHPLNDVVRGESLVKRVYEAVRNSRLWERTMLVVTFDEHGGFFDHVPPPAALPTGDDRRYASRGKRFAFDQYGVRVPTVVVSPYTARGTVVGAKPDASRDVFDHCAIPATLRKRFGWTFLSKREAIANTLDVALNLGVPRNDAPTRLPEVRVTRRKARAALTRRIAPRAETLTKEQEAVLGLAMAIDRRMNPRRARPLASMAATRTGAKAYVARVQGQALKRRAKRSGGRDR